MLFNFVIYFHNLIYLYFQLIIRFQPVVRKPKVFKPLKIPKRLQRQLPYKDRPKISKIGHNYDSKKDRVAIVRDAHEYKVSFQLYIKH